MNKILSLFFVLVLLLLSGPAYAQEPAPPRDQLVYLPVVTKFPVSPRPGAVTAKVYNAMGQELPNGDVVWNEIHIRVDALGCSSVYPGFVGIDREIYPPTYYHLECTMPDTFGYDGPTTGANVLIYLYSPMFWSDFAVTVYYPNGFLQTVMVRGPWWYGVQP